MPSYDQVSDRSSYYEKVDGPNPAYQQYNRKGKDGIPIRLMEPKHNAEIVKNELYDTVGVTDIEDQPTIVHTSQPSTNVTNDVPPIYAVVNKSTSATSGFSRVHVCQDADVVPVSSYLKVEDVNPEDHNTATSPDMSMFISNSHVRLDNKIDHGTEGDISASMGSSSDEGSASIAKMAAVQQVCRADSIMSTTSDDRDLLDTTKKLKDHPKGSHTKPNILGNLIDVFRHTPSPKPKRTSPLPTAKSTGADDEVFSEADDNMTTQQQKKQVERTGSTQSTTSDDRYLLDTSKKRKDHPKASISKPKFLSNATGAAKNTPSPKPKQTDLSKAKSSTTDGKLTQTFAKGATPGSKMTQSVAKEHVDNHDNKQVTSFTQAKPPQANFKPTIPSKFANDHKSMHKDNPKLKPNKNQNGNQAATPSLKSTKPGTPRMSPKVAPTTGAYLNTSHPSQTNPLAQLRARSSPRVKPRSASPAMKKEPDPKATDSTKATNSAKATDSTKATQVTKQLSVTEPSKRSSLATDKPVVDDDEKDENRRHTVCTLSFKERREKEKDEFDQALQDLDDFITAI